MVSCFGNFSPMADECRVCRVKARCASRTAHDGFGVLVYPRYNGVDLSYRANPETTDNRDMRTLHRVERAGFTVRGCLVFLGNGRTFARVKLRRGYIAVNFFHLTPQRVMEISSGDSAEVLVWRKRCDTGLHVMGCIALCMTPRVASLLIRSVAVSLSA